MSERDEVLEAFSHAMRDDLARLLMAASGTVSADALAHIDPAGTSGVRLAHLPVIAALEPGGSRLTAIAQRIGVTRQAVAGIVRDLERAGMVRVEPDPHDGRAVHVVLTDAGAAFCTAALTYMARREEQWRADLGSARVDDLKALLRALAGEEPPR